MPLPSDKRSDALPTTDGSDCTTMMPVANHFVVPTILGGLVAGTLDIGAASLINGAKPTRILQVISSGLLGKSALPENLTIGLGLVLQWTMSIIIAAIFVFTVRRRPAIRRHWVKAGLAYGIIIFVVMNYVVLPLSAIGHPPRFRIVHFMEDIVAMLLFGIIIAFFARERSTRRQA